MNFSIRNLSGKISNLGAPLSQLQNYLSDGNLSSTEREQIKSNISNKISDFSTQNPEVVELLNLIKDSVDNIPTKEELQTTATKLRDILKGGITAAEYNQIVDGLQQAGENLGITASEAHSIILQAEVVAAVSGKVAATADSITGTNGNDVLFGKGGSDILNGAGTNLGANQTDLLIGGSGADTFVLGTSQTAFYRASRANDYALILDFDLANGDKIQLSGTSTSYTLGAIPASLQTKYPNLDGTAIFATNQELIGILYGTEVTNFNSGFSFI